jgi:hypothetical protein
MAAQAMREIARTQRVSTTQTVFIKIGLVMAFHRYTAIWRISTMTTKVELGTRVRAKRDFPVYWKIGRGKKIADIKEGMDGIVTGFDRGIPIVNAVDYLLPVTLEPFDDLWERDRTVQLQVQKYAQQIVNETGMRCILADGTETTVVYPETTDRGTNQ